MSGCGDVSALVPCCCSTPLGPQMVCTFFRRVRSAHPRLQSSSALLGPATSEGGWRLRRVRLAHPRLQSSSVRGWLASPQGSLRSLHGYGVTHLSGRVLPRGRRPHRRVAVGSVEFASFSPRLWRDTPVGARASARPTAPSGPHYSIAAGERSEPAEDRQRR